MDGLPTVDNLLYVVLAMIAWAIVRRDGSHRPLAAYISWMAASELLRGALGSLKDGAPKPYTGIARVAAHGDQLIVLSWSFLFVALCLHYFLARKPWAPLAAWLTTFVVCVVGYPMLRGHALGLVYGAVTFGSLLASWGCITWAILRRRKVEPKLAHLVLILYASTDVATAIIQVTRDYFKGWPVTLVSNLLLLCALVAVHVHDLAKRARVEEIVA
jgi:hypothetical protein